MTSVSVDRPEGQEERAPFVIASSWGMGQLAAWTGMATLSTQILFFLTGYVGMSPATAGAILAAAKISDIFTDIAVGLLSDRIDTRWGRRRPWALMGSILVGVTLAGMFALNHVPTGWAAALCVAAVLLFYVGFTSVYVPLVAMSAEIVKGYRATGVLWGYGMLFNMIGNAAFGTTGAALLILWYGGGARGYNLMGLTMAAIIIAAGIIGFVGTAKAPRTPAREAPPPPPIREWFASLVGNGSLIAYLISEAVCWLAVSMLQVTMTFYLFDILRLGQQGMIVYGAAGIPSSFLAIWLATVLQKWFPKHVLSAVSAIGCGIVVLVLRTFNEHTGIVAFGILVFVWGLLAMGRNLMAAALMPDLIRADVLKTGLRREGAIAAFVGVIQKTTPAVSTIAFSFLLAASGYLAGKPGHQQPQSAIDAIYLINCVIPGILLIGSSAILFFFYRLTEQRLRELEAAAATP